MTSETQSLISEQERKEHVETLIKDLEQHKAQYALLRRKERACHQEYLHAKADADKALGEVQDARSKLLSFIEKGTEDRDY